MPSDAEPACASAVRNGPAGEDGTASAKGARVSGPGAAGDSTSAGLSAESGTMNGGGSPGGSVANTLKWSRVVRQGRPRRKINEEQPVSLKQRVGDWRAAKQIIGTAAQGNIKVVRMKLVSVFATKFTPDLDAETLSSYLTKQLGHDVKCERIATASNRYSSFKVCAECNDVMEMYNPELWPEGCLVRRYYEPRKAGRIGAGTARLIVGPNAPNGATAVLPS